MTLNRRQMLQAGLGLAAAGALSSCAGLTGRNGGETRAVRLGPDAESHPDVRQLGRRHREEGLRRSHRRLHQRQPQHHDQDRDGPLRQHPDQHRLPLPGRQPAGPVPGVLHRHRPVHQPGRAARRLAARSTRPRSTPSCRVCGRASSTTASRTGSRTRSTCTALLYRKDAFEAAGITDVPTTLDDAWTWEQFADVANKLKGVVKGKQSPFIYDWQAGRAPTAG